MPSPKNLTEEADRQKDFPGRLKALMKEQGVSQERLGALLGSKRQTVGTYTTGKSNPDIAALGLMADLFSVSCDYLLCRTDTRTPKTETRAVCNQYGLSEDALKLLAFTKSRMGSVMYPETLNALITQGGKDAHDYPALQVLGEYLFLEPQDRGVFVDEAITGTKDNRPGFQSMLDECHAGNVDLVITKSLSRFARNTVTILKSIRELKALGVDIFFEKENISSLDGQGELLLTIMASMAQEESRSLSLNVTWGQRKRMQDGKVLPFKKNIQGA